jgi:hypothetical protein
VLDDNYDYEVEERSTQRATPPTTTTPVADDVLSAYVSRNGGKRADNGGHKWNEHDYYMKAMEDMRQHHENKINKVRDFAAPAIVINAQNRSSVICSPGGNPKGRLVKVFDRCFLWLGIRQKLDVA